jgi:hypothetical protein
LTVLLGNVGNYYLGAPFGKGEGSGFANPGRSPGNEYDLVSEIHIVVVEG